MKTEKLDDPMVQTVGASNFFIFIFIVFTLTKSGIQTQPKFNNNCTKKSETPGIHWNMILACIGIKDFRTDFWREKRRKKIISESFDSSTFPYVFPFPPPNP